MIICTAVWGAEYIDWFKRGLLESFKLPKNRAVVEKAHWIICNSEPKERAALEALAREVCPSVEFIHSRLWDGIKLAIQKAYEMKRPFVLAPPDNAFSDGCLANLATVGAQPSTVVALPHVRVIPSFLDDFKNHGEPGKMVNHAWRHLHDSWVLSGDTQDPSACHDGGVYWKKIAPNLIGVQHHLPTAFFVNLTQADSTFFKNQQILGCWDMIWPPQMLINQQRWRYLGSSDAGFIVETTHPGRNVPQKLPRNPTEPDLYKGKDVNNWVCRETIAILRGDAPF